MHCNLQKKDKNFVEQKIKISRKKLRIFCKHKCDYSVKIFANIAYKILLCEICLHKISRKSLRNTKKKFTCFSKNFPLETPVMAFIYGLENFNPVLR